MIFIRRINLLLFLFASSLVVFCDFYYDPFPSYNIKIIRPHSNSEWKVGSKTTIKWDSVDISNHVRIDLYNNSQFITSIDTVAPNNYLYDWWPPDYLRHGENYQIRISDAKDTNVGTFSDEFLIYKSVNFPDENLETIIEYNLGNPNDITTIDLLHITTIDAHDQNIWNIAGIGNCTNMTDLDISNNYFYSINELPYLTNLTRLIISTNDNIITLDSINSLYNIEELDISWLKLTNLSIISNLIKLKKLSVGYNNISDISILDQLSKVDFLSLSNNFISDISPLSNLNNIRVLMLNSNDITDISPLITNHGINNGDYIFLTDNPLSEESINIFIPQLLARGVNVTY